MNDAITVTKGNLTDEELGALVTVLAELTRPSPNAYVPDDRPIAFGWKSYWRTIREP
ncbi:acyl-CoA carboxylase subunit epsilon, partial [Xanthomonas citri pv. citri]|nr:acyl-CoA carboxylase subunit epsilon [Xanthomonas citri pv. citri]